MPADPEPDTQGSSLAKVVRTGLVLFVVLILVMALAAWLLGDDLLPMEYEGFD